MKHFAKFLLCAITLTLVAAMVLPVAAQEEPGKGGIIVEGSTSEPGTFNPFYCTSTSCQDDALAFMLPQIVPVDPNTAEFVKDGRTIPGSVALAIDWEASEDGTVYTFTLRDDVFWSDGTPVTAHDAVWSFETAVDPEANTRYGYMTEYVAGMKAIDDYTLEVTFTEGGCGVIRYTDATNNTFPMHVFADTPLAELEGHPYGTNPDVTAGVFKFLEYLPGEQFSLASDQNFWNSAAEEGVMPTGRVVKVVPDATVQLEQFLAGELNFYRNISAIQQNDVREAADAGTHQVYEFGGNTWDYMGLNQADPENVQPGLDEDGNLIDQGHHPILGDQKIRMAIAKGIDVDSIIEGAVLGNGTRMPSVITPSSWALHPELEPIAYDPEGAMALIEEAGWEMGDDGVYVAVSSEYAEPGTRLAFELRTNAGNTRREAIATIIQDQLAQIGFEVDFQTIEWNALLELTDSQTYDAVIMGWRAGYPDDPAASVRQIFGVASDLPGAGSNDMSYYNPKVEELVAEAVAVEGCAQEDMAPYFWEIQEIMQEDLPYVWLFAQNGMYAATSGVENFDPRPAQPYWNISAWAVAAP